MMVMMMMMMPTCTGTRAPGQVDGASVTSVHFHQKRYRQAKTVKNMKKTRCLRIVRTVSVLGKK
jgi:hypothetical protein